MRQYVRVGLAVLDGRDIDRAKLEQRRGRVAVCVVVRERLQHGGQHGRAHDAEILAERVEDGRGDAARVIFRPADHVIELRGDERMAHCLVKTGLAAGQGDILLGQLLGCVLALHHFAGVQRGRDLVVAVHARDFFSKITHARNVHAERRDDDLAVLHAELEALQICLLLVGRQVKAEQRVHLVRLERQRLGGQVGSACVDDAVHDFACAEHFHQLARTLHSGHGQRRVKALLETAGRLGTHAKRLGRHTHGRAVEAGGLEYDGLGVVLDFGVGAAHNARDGNRLVVVADGEHLVGQVVILSVQSLNGLAVPCAAHDDLSVREAGIVKRMHRLAVLKHDVVGDINDVVDRAHTAGVQTLAHPRRGRLDLDVLDQTRGVARAKVGVHHLNRHILVDVVARALDHRLLDRERALKGRSGFARQTDHAEAVSAVGGDFKVGNVVVQTEHLLDVLAYGRAFRQEQNAVLAGVGHAAVRQSQLLERAHHAVGDFAAQLALGDFHTAGQRGLVQRDRADFAHRVGGHVGRTGDDLDGFALPHVDLANLEVVGVRMIDDRQHLAGHDVFDLCAEVVDLLDLGAGHGQAGVILLGGNAGNIGIIRKPGKWQFHNGLALLYRKVQDIAPIGAHGYRPRSAVVKSPALPDFLHLDLAPLGRVVRVSRTSFSGTCSRI